MALILAYAAGLLTLVNPCVLPVLPVVLATALQAGRWGPVALAAGMGASFVALGLGVAAAGPALGIDPDGVARAGALAMMAFGAVLLLPRLSAGFATATAGLAARADAGLDRIDRTGPTGQLLGGALLGAVWSPCIGPTLGGAIALASRGESLGAAATVMAAFSLGVATLVLGIAYGARAALRRRQDLLRALAARARPLLGAAFLIVGAAILAGVHHRIEGFLLDRMPPWLVDLSVSL